MKDLDFTGERVVPGKVEPALWSEHLARYCFAARWVAGKRVLDFGCGTGYGADLLKAAGARRVVGCDVAVEAASYARSRFGGKDLHFVVCDCLEAALGDARFDAVVSFEAIEHVTSHRDYLSEARRVLESDGLLIISTPNKKVYSDEREGEKNPFHYRELYLDEFRAALAAHFSAVTIFGQTSSEGPFFANISSPRLDPRVTLLEDRSAQGGTSWAEESESFEYFVAICSPSSLPDGMSDLPNYFSLSEATELRTLRRRLAELQEEFDERSRWALDLDRQLDATGKRLLQLQNEFDERTEWALQLDARVFEQHDRIYELQDQLEKSRQRIEELEKAIEERGSPAA